MYLGVEFGLCPLWLGLLQTGQQSPATTRRFLSTTSPSASLWRRTLGHLSSLNFHIPDGIFQMRMLQLFLEDQWDFLDDQFQVSSLPLFREFFFSIGLEWPSCVKEHPSLLQSKKSASYQTLWMWVAGPHRRTPHLGPFVSLSDDSLHQPERASSSSVRPEGLRTPVDRPIGRSVLRQHHHSSVCPSPTAIHHGLVRFQSGRSQSPSMVVGPEWTLHHDIALSAIIWCGSSGYGPLL